MITSAEWREKNDSFHDRNIFVDRRRTEKKNSSQLIFIRCEVKECDHIQIDNHKKSLGIVENQLFVKILDDRNKGHLFLSSSYRSLMCIISSNDKVPNLIGENRGKFFLSRSMSVIFFFLCRTSLKLDELVQLPIFLSRKFFPATISEIFIVERKFCRKTKLEETCFCPIFSCFLEKILNWVRERSRCFYRSKITVGRHPHSHCAKNRFHCDNIDEIWERKPNLMRISFFTIEARWTNEIIGKERFDFLNFECFSV